MTSLHLELQCCAPALGSFLSWCILFYGWDVSCPTPTTGFFNAFGKASPACALLPQLDSSETFYHRLIGNEPVKQFPDDRLIFQQTFPLLFDIVSIMEGDQLPETLTAVISKVSVQQKWINTRCCATGCTPHKWCRILSLPACGKKSWWLLPGWHNSKHLRKEEYSTPILTSWSFLSALQTRYNNVMSLY